MSIIVEKQIFIHKNIKTPPTYDRVSDLLIFPSGLKNVVVHCSPNKKEKAHHGAFKKFS